jgi:16S rRNA (adenine1518-N6/adenine1519-N6)-dimethyltransferase
MLQREVVERMSAQPGTSEYGRLSVMLQYRWSIESLFDVPPTAFRPVPKVWSSVVRMIPHRVLPNAADDEKLLAEVVMRAFGQRRKTLRNTFREMLLSSDFEQLGIDPVARGETLSVADFVRIANFMVAARS